MNKTIWHIVDPTTKLIRGRRFSKAAAEEYVERYNKVAMQCHELRRLKVLRSDVSLAQGYRNASSPW